MEETSAAKPRRGRPARSFAQHGQTREALIRAGMELFTTQGFVTTGVELVLKRLSIPKGSFYHYFSSKEAFGREVLAAYDGYIGRKLDRWLNAPARPALDRILDFVADARRGMERHAYIRGCLVANYGQEVAALPDGFREELDRVLTGWQSKIMVCLQHGQSRGEISPGLDCSKLAAMFWIGWEGAILRARLQRSGAALDTFAQAFVQLVRH
jgi:TetR/AcrR family transcriptional repressor of nem operon